MGISRNWLAIIGMLIVGILGAVSLGLTKGTLDIPSNVQPYVPIILTFIAVVTPKLEVLFGNAQGGASPGADNWRSLGMGLIVLVLSSIAQAMTSPNAGVPPGLSVYVPIILAILTAATGQLQRITSDVVSPNNSANGPPTAP